MKQAKRPGRQPIPSGTWIDYAKRLFPNANDATADAVIWSCTAFPFVTARLVMRQLERARRKSGGDIRVALRRAHAELRRTRLPLVRDQIQHSERCALRRATAACRDNHAGPTS